MRRALLALGVLAVAAAAVTANLALLGTADRVDDPIGRLTPRAGTPLAPPASLPPPPAATPQPAPAPPAPATTATPSPPLRTTTDDHRGRGRGADDGREPDD